MAATGELPKDIKDKVIGKNFVQEDQIDAIMDSLMNPVTDEPSTQSKFHFYLDKIPRRKWPKPRQHTRKTLSYKERRILGLYSIGKSSLKYNDLLPLHSLWLDYMKKYLNLEEYCQKEEKSEDDYIQQTGIKLYRADYHGAEFMVNRSVCPGYVGKGGIVAMETKNCFLLVGKDNVTRKIPKLNCEFTFEVGEFKFSFFGKNFISRPADRSSRKIKTIHAPIL